MEIIKRKYKGSSGEGIEPDETIDEQIIDVDDDRIFELEKQLHEQYAINNNSKASTLTSLIGSLLIVMTGYGYVLYNYRTGECRDLPIVYLAAFVVSAVMVLLYCVCVYLGSDQRMEQFVVSNIRMKYYGKDSDSYSHIYPDKYHPFGKTYCNFVQGLYNVLTKAFLLALGTVVFSCWCLTEASGKFIMWGIVCLILCVVYRCRRFCKYKQREAKEWEDSRKRPKGASRPTYYYPCTYVCYSVIVTVIVCVLAFMVLVRFFPKQDTPPFRQQADSTGVRIGNVLDSIAVQNNRNLNNINASIWNLNKPISGNYTLELHKAYSEQNTTIDQEQLK